MPSEVQTCPGPKRKVFAPTQDQYVNTGLHEGPISKLTAPLVFVFVASCRLPSTPILQNSEPKQNREIRQQQQRPPAMEKGKGLARRWAVELHDASSSSSSSAFPDPPGFTRSAPEAVPSSFSLLSCNCSFPRCDRGIHVLFFLARRTTPPPLGSARRPRPPGRGRFARFPDARPTSLLGR